MPKFNGFILLFALAVRVLSEELDGDTAKLTPAAQTAVEARDSSEFEDIESGIKASTELLVRADLKGAIGILNGLIKKNPNSAELFVARGRAYMNSGLCSDAIKDFDEALQKSSDLQEVEFQKADCLHLLSRNEEALGLVDSMVQRGNAGYFIYYNRGLFLFKLKNYVESIESFTKALEIDKSSSRAYEARAAAFQALDSHERALKDINKALQIEPRNAAYYYQRAVFYHRVGAENKAMADADMSIRLDGKFSPAYTLKAKLEINREEFEAGMKNLDKAIELDPDNCSAYYSRGFLKYMLGRTVDAEQDFNSAMSRDNRFKVAY